MIDFSQVLEIVLGSSVVEQITNSRGDILWSKAGDDPANSYFYVEDISGTDNTLSITNTNNDVYYSTDKSNWTLFNGTATIPANGKLYLKANVNTWVGWDGRRISASGNHNVCGNIMSLLYGDDFDGKTEFPSGSYNNFAGLFVDDTHLINAVNLIFPATTLTSRCYNYMFGKCSSLTTAPTILPATTLTYSCYGGMFEDCVSLATAPALPATTLAERCYENMFWRCASLTQAPELPATTLASWCYRNLFNGCTNINTITTYAQDISATNCLIDWVGGVASTGDFYNLGGATYSVGSDGIPLGWTEHKGTPDEYFWMENPSNNQITVYIETDGSAPIFDLYYSTDKVNWQKSEFYVDIEPQSKVYMKANTDKWATTISDYIHFDSMDEEFNVGGNIMSLLYGDNYKNVTAFTTDNTYAFVSLFYGSKVVDASQLKLPTNTVSNCYQRMFRDCASLTEAPVLPATALNPFCYREMFYGCTLLNKIVSYAEDASVASIKTSHWLDGVSATGDFYNLGNAGYTSGANGIPEGWTEHTSL